MMAASAAAMSLRKGMCATGTKRTDAELATKSASDPEQTLRVMRKGFAFLRLLTAPRRIDRKIGEARCASG
jgi:hypothetical protein